MTPLRSCIIAALLLASCNALRVTVNSHRDAYLTHVGCATESPEECSLRNAVSYCMAESPSNCDIIVSNQMDIFINATFGTIVVKSFGMVQLSIIGEHSRITPTIPGFQLLRFDGMGSSSFRISLYNMTISGFGMSAAQGGSLFVNYVTSYVMSGVAIDNSYGELGGALYITYSKNILIENCSFEDNTASGNGGAVMMNFYVVGVTMSHTRFVSNTANNAFVPSGGFGGGGAIFMYYYNSLVTLNDCEFYFNIAPTGYGGSIASYVASDLTLINSSFHKNQAGLDGGACWLYLNHENALLSDNVFVGNVASRGVLFFGINNFGNTMQRLHFENNIVNEGSIYFDNGNLNFYIERCTFVNNIATKSGAGINIYYGGSSIYITDCAFVNNTAVSGFAGALNLDTANINVFVTNSIFRNNSCREKKCSSGAVLLRNANNGVYIESCTFESNWADLDGGALSLFGLNKNIYVIRSSFHDNAASDGGGGGVLLYTMNSGIYFDQCSFRNNSSLRGSGGAIIMQDKNSVVQFTGCLFADNSASIDAGALFMEAYNTDVSISKTRFIGNAAHGGNGGAIFLENGNDRMKIESSSLEYNLAVHHGVGMAIRCGNDHLTVINTIFRGNTVSSSSSGAALYSAILNSHMLISQSLFEKHDSGELGAVFIGSDHTNVIFNDTVWRDNVATTGAAIFISDFSHNVQLLSCVCVNNVARVSNTGGGRGGCLFAEYAYDLKIKNMIFEANIAGTGAAIYLSLSSTVHIAESVFRNNTSRGSAGAMYIEASGTVFILSSHFLGNRANTFFVNGTGGALSMQGAAVQLIGTVFDDNKGAQMGGACFGRDMPSLFIYDCSFTDNAADLGGSITSIDNARLVVTTSSYIGNFATTENGGAITILGSGTADITQSMFRNNTAGTHGSAIYMSHSRVNLTKNSFTSNVAAGAGCVYWLVNTVNTDSTPPSLFKNTFVENTALYGLELATNAVSVEVIMGNNSFRSNDLNVFVISAYNAPVPSFKVVLHDYYNQIVVTDSDAYTEISVVKDSYFCNDDDGYVTGGTVERFLSGEAVFESLEVKCSPLGYMSLLVETDTKFKNYYPVEFRSCYRGEYYSRGMCLACPQGSFSLKDNADLSVTTCRSCPDEADTCYSDQIVLKDGYWRVSADATTAIRCPLGSRSCLGGNLTGVSSCVEGYEGSLCAVCSDDYYFSSGDYECKPCGDFSVNPFTLIFVAVILGGVVAAVFWRVKSKKTDTPEDFINRMLVKFGLLKNRLTSEDLKSLSVHRKKRIALWRAKLKLYITLYQIVVSAPYVLNLTFPKFYTQMANIFSILTFNIFQESGASCGIHNFDYIDYLFFTTLTPVAVTLLLWICNILHIFVYKSRHSELSAAEKANTVFELKSLYFSLFLGFTYLVLPGVSIAIFRTFGCTDTDPDNVVAGNDYYMRADYSISCSSDRYFLGQYWAVAMIFVYPVGVPLYYFYILNNAKVEIMSRDTGDTGSIAISDSWSRSNGKDSIGLTVAGSLRVLHILKPLQFLYSVYKPSFWFWEVIETFQRILFTGILSIISQGTSVQILVAMLFASGFIKLYHQYNPWVSESVSATKNVIQWQIYFLFLYALLVRNDILNSGHAIIITGLILLVFINVVIEIWYIIYPRLCNFYEFGNFSDGVDHDSKQKSQLLYHELSAAIRMQEQLAVEISEIQRKIAMLSGSSGESNEVHQLVSGKEYHDGEGGDVALTEIKSPMMMEVS